ncbi:MAG: DUF2399 domain-containing protein, partial [Sciscionella sp.]
HGLDARQPLGRAVARLAAVLGGLPRPLRAGRAWRDAWASVGVRCDGVSPRVLVLNLPLSGDSPSARLCAVAAGEPIWLTMRSLSGNWSVPEPRTVFVCENPTVLEAAADLLGADCPPMVCTDGFASGAALDLIGGLSDAGCRLRIRADVDPAGFSIVDQIRSVAPDASLWRFDIALYSDVTGAPASSGESRETGPTLRELSDEHGVALHEERVLDQLLADLADLATDAG